MRDTKAKNNAAKQLLSLPKGRFEEIDLIFYPKAPEWMTRCFKNNRYVVMIDDFAPMSNGITAIKAMVQRHDNEPIPNHWREMQSIKNEIFGKEITAIEYYPAESKLMDAANIYWLWILNTEYLPLAVFNQL